MKTGSKRTILVNARKESVVAHCYVLQTEFVAVGEHLQAITMISTAIDIHAVLHKIELDQRVVVQDSEAIADEVVDDIALNKSVLAHHYKASPIKQGVTHELIVYMETYLLW